MVLWFPIALFGQRVEMRFQIKDANTQENLTGVTVRYDKTGTRSNLNGIALIKTNEGVHEFIFSYTGYETLTLKLDIKQKQEEIQIQLKPVTKELNITTVSGSRFEKRISEEITSIEVIKPATILSRADNSLDDALQRVPGVDVIDNQVNIRGGSGWSYGAGSRVLVLVDDMPMLTGDAADAKWDFLPLENCEQIEVLKGASSALYGSSALNGVINFRTGFAKSKPHTKIMLYNGLYGNPPDKSWAWWGKQQPGFQGGYLMHAQKFGQLDVVFGSAWFSEDSYLQGDLNRRARGNLNLRYRFKKIQGLTVGINANVQKNKSQTFFFWQPDSIHGDRFLQPFGGLEDTSTTINKNNGFRGNIDPYLTFYARNGGRHTLRTRWFRSNNSIPEKKQSSIADTYFGEYQYQQSIESYNPLLNKLNIVLGWVNSFSNVNGLLYGSHKVFNSAPYLQLEKKFNRLWTTLGARYEINQVDSYKVEKRPVFRAGANYELTKYMFLRASYGQGYRYPSVAERFVETNFGAASVFKNVDLTSETGWSSEIGLKTAYKINSWLGFIDIAGFWMEYKNMMEFNFGFFPPEGSNPYKIDSVQYYLEHFVGFKSINVGRSRINGIDISIMGQGKIIRTVTGRFVFGYTYMNPVLVNPDSNILRNVSGPTHTLKYRYRNSVKMDMELSWKRITWGNTFLYNSFMQNVDETFEATKPKENPIGGSLFQIGTGLPTSVHAFRQKYYKGSFVWDTRLAYQFTPQVKASFIIRNALNTIYAERPALIGPLRNSTLQLLYDM